MQRERLMGFAHSFRPMYAGANMGHPSDFLPDLLRRGVRRYPGTRPVPFGFGGARTGCYLVVAWAVWSFGAAQSS